jgi:hypothetical protein
MQRLVGLYKSPGAKDPVEAGTETLAFGPVRLEMASHLI